MAKTRTRAKLGVALLTLAGSVASGATQALESRIDQPRPFGYSIGDVVHQTIRIRAGSSDTLIPESLPKTGRAGAWLERTQADVTRTDEGYRLDLAYQFVNSPLEIRTLSLPSIKLQFHAGKQIVEESVGEWPVTLAPITPATVLAREGLEEMRPDAPPPLIDEHVYVQRLALYGAGLGVLALLWLSWYVGVSLRGLRPRPFARAWRSLRKAARATPDMQAYRDALRRLHRAFDTTAGTTVFAERLDMFFATHPVFVPARTSVESFYAESRHAFFDAHGTSAHEGALGDGGDSAAKWAALLALAAQMRRLEREVR